MQPGANSIGGRGTPLQTRHRSPSDRALRLARSQVARAGSQKSGAPPLSGLKGARSKMVCNHEQD
jgi:hypothetical protein